MSERKRTKTQRAILHAAKGLYEKYGVGNVPFDDIADAADVCRTTVFNHFADMANSSRRLRLQRLASSSSLANSPNCAGWY